MNAPTKPHEIVATRSEWTAALEILPSLDETNGKIPSIFLAHGQPLLIYPDHLPLSGRMAPIADIQGPKGTLAQFLRDLGPALMKNYSPKAIVVFSAHWETEGETLVTDYGQQNPLLYDFYGFPEELYKTEFQSSGDHNLSERIVSLLKEKSISARTVSTKEARGRDGRGFQGPGFDHGVFVPFKLMFNDKSAVPVVQVSIDMSLKPEKEFELGAALETLRSEGVLIIAGGLTIHSFDDFSAFSPKTAKPIFKEFERAIIDAVTVEQPVQRKQAMFDLVHHPGFRPSHPREEHFVPLYIAQGAAAKDAGTARVIFGAHGAKTIVFGV